MSDRRTGYVEGRNVAIEYRLSSVMLAVKFGKRLFHNDEKEWKPDEFRF
jgi:hypothetical protein